MARHEKSTFTGEKILLDGNEYFACHFERCTIMFHGTAPYNTSGCSFVHCRWGFGGPAALVLQFMNDLYKEGGEFRELVEQTFENIRMGRNPGRSVELTKH